MIAKKILYVTAFTSLGILVQFLVHSSVEIFYLRLMFEDFSHWGFGMSWGTWFFIHHFLSLALLVAGIIIGYRSGAYWWRRIYDRTLHHPIGK